MESWDETCKVLDRRMPFPGGRMKWKTATASTHTTYNSKRGRNFERHQLVDIKRSDERGDYVRTLLAADIRIYDELALPAFDKQFQ